MYDWEETDNFVNLSYSVTPNPVTISLTGATLVGAQQEALTGQQATLDTPFQVDPTSYSWSVGGGMFKNASTGTLSSNQKTELTDADYFQSSFTFYDATRETLNLTGYATVICPDNTRLNLNAQQQIIDSQADRDDLGCEYNAGTLTCPPKAVPLAR